VAGDGDVDALVDTAYRNHYAAVFARAPEYVVAIAGHLGVELERRQARVETGPNQGMELPKIVAVDKAALPIPIVVSENICSKRYFVSCLF
jgi:hypothetical protein